MDGDMKIEVLISDVQTHQDLWEDKNRDLYLTVEHQPSNNLNVVGGRREV